MPRLLCALLYMTLSLLTVAQAAPSMEGIQVYQKNLHLLPEHKQKLAAAIDRYKNADNFWDVLRDEFALEHYEDSPLVQEKIEWFMNNQDFLLRSATRAAPYLYYISQQVKKRHLPAELVLLPIVESGYNPFSTSNMGATGIWQLMPGTASGLGIKHSWWYDGRRDVIASTRAALNYLAYLQNFFEGNWLLAIAAYNTGEGNVLTAIKKNIRDGKDTDFWSLPVAQQTKDYVPSLLALAVIIAHPEQYPINFPPVQNAPYLAEVEVGSHINLNEAASLAGMSAKKMLALNSGYHRQATSNPGPHKLVLPIEKVEQFTENLSHTQPRTPSVNWLKSTAKNTMASKASMPSFRSNSDTIKLSAKYTLQPGDTIYMVRVRDTLKSIAKRFKVSDRDIMASNQLRNKNILPGKQLIIPTHTPADNSGLQPGDTLYMVRKGDTIDSIASKFKTTASTIRLVNLVDDNSLQEGQRIVVPTHMRG